MAKHGNIGDRLTTVGEHHRHVSQHPTTVVPRDEAAPRHRPGQLASQSAPVSQEPGRDAARMRHHLGAITRHTKPADHEVRFTYGVPSTREPQTISKSKFPLSDRHFRAVTLRSTHDPVNDPG